ncbi:MAG TPA: class IIb bacteriocin, lactobin A/cerein 7B family [Flavobacteriaceae bacterium]|nr:class IIb bacteriocin, lactobin A/cerein 7B family [Flavobacteriaceae bacterium]
MKNKSLILNFKKIKNLENYGVQELDAKEVVSVDGGFLPLIFIALLLVTAPINAY